MRDQARGAYRTVGAKVLRTSPVAAVLLMAGDPVAGRYRRSQGNLPGQRHARNNLRETIDLPFAVTAQSLQALALGR